MLVKVPPPPYRSNEGQFPMLKGTVGEIQMEGLEKEKQIELDVRPKKLQG